MCFPDNLHSHKWHFWLGKNAARISKSLDPSRDTLCALTASYNHLNTEDNIACCQPTHWRNILCRYIALIASCEISTLINSCFINNVEFEMAFHADISVASRYCQPIRLWGCKRQPIADWLENFPPISIWLHC